MPDEEKKDAKISFSLIEVDASGVSDTGKLLIERASAAFGGFFAPWQKRRIAEADADAAAIAAHAEVRVTDIQRRAATRWLAEEERKQQNMESILAKAAAQVKPDAKPEKMDEDWMAHFFEKSRLVSNEGMQQLWAQVLAGEANTAGKFSRRTVDFLSSMSKADAEALSTLMRFAWDFSTPQPLIYDFREKIYQDNGLNFKALTHLDAIGLIRFQPMASYQAQGFPHRIALVYQFTVATLEFPGDEKATNNNLSTGQISLTQVGVELGGICKAPEVPGYFDYVLAHWRKLGIKAEKLGSLSPEQKR